jgi:NADH dehydrogenase
METHCVTGAFGFSGKYIARRLLNEGYTVKTLTNSGNRKNDFDGKIEVIPFNFDEPEKLAKSLEGIDVLYNTYWVRFNHTDFKHSIAVENTCLLFDAAKKAGVKKIVHTSITNPSEDSPLEYFSGKAKLEKELINLGIPYSILRPAVLFGNEDILINNIAWTLRKLLVFGIFGDGTYKLQPIFVDDFAEIAVAEGKNRENKIIDAIGPETYTYKELVEMIGNIIGRDRLILKVSNGFGLFVTRIIGKMVGDKIITREEIEGLKSNLLFTNSEPTGKTKLTEWIMENAQTLGKHYASEIGRRTDRTKSYI